MADLSNVRVVCSPLTGELYVTRFGKRPDVALDKRPAEEEVVTAFVAWMLHGMSGAATKRTVWLADGQSYELTVTPKKRNKKERDDG